MADLALIIRAQMRSLCTRFGCFDAVADTILAATGEPCAKSTISKRLAGALSWPAEDIAAIEDALGLYPVTEALMRRRAARASPSALPLLSHAGAIAKETGEAIAAALAAATSSTGGDYATALVELREAGAAIAAAEAAIVELMDNRSAIAAILRARASAAAMAAGARRDLAAE